MKPIRFLAQITSLAILLALPAASLAQTDVPFSAEGTFTFTHIRGFIYEVSGNGHASPGGDFTFRDIVPIEYGGRVVDAMITFVFASGSTLTFCWELPIDEARVVQGPYEVVGGTGLFQGASGTGVVWYPIGQGAPLTMDGTLSW